MDFNKVSKPVLNNKEKTLIIEKLTITVEPSEMFPGSYFAYFNQKPFFRVYGDLEVEAISKLKDEALNEFDSLCLDTCTI